MRPSAYRLSFSARVRFLTLWAVLAGAGPALGQPRLAAPETGPAPAAAGPGAGSLAPAPPDLVARRKRRLRLLVGGSALSYGVIYTGLTTA